LIDPHINPPRALVVTADDFGFGVPTSRGIVRAHQIGVVTSTSLMAVTGDHASASVPLLADAPDLEVGVHLVVTGRAQKPLIATPSSGLVSRDGNFHSLTFLLWLALRKKIDRSAIFDEIAAQARRCTQLLGRPPAYVDGHHHAHQLPVIREALIDAIKGGVLPPIARCTVESSDIRKSVTGCLLRRNIMNRLGVAALPLFHGAGIKTNDSCFGMISTADLQTPFPWSRYLPHLPSTGCVEWFVHPGELDSTLIGRDTYLAGRALELKAFESLATDPAWPPFRARLTTKSKYLSSVPS
jgi:predicted glycoside hydrolase/deacetylase ChbG (UPF0249 family)